VFSFVCKQGQLGTMVVEQKDLEELEGRQACIAVLPLASLGILVEEYISLVGSFALPCMVEEGQLLEEQGSIEEQLVEELEELGW